MIDKVKLDLIIQGIEGQTDEMSAFYNILTKEIAYVSDEEFGLAEDEASLEELDDWLQENIKTAEDILFGSDWIQLPSSFEIYEYNIMEKFSLSIEEETLSNIIYDSIKGRGAFKRFRDNIQKYNLENDWYRFRDEDIKKIAIEWCEVNNVEYEK